MLHEFIRNQRIARLATVDKKGHPYVVPICYVFDGEFIFFVLDQKPKTLKLLELKRVRNIVTNPQVSLVIDKYYEDWQKLGFVTILGKANLLQTGKEHVRVILMLKEKYIQYKSMRIDHNPIIKITITKMIAWGDLQSADTNN